MLKVTDQVSIPEEELRFTASRSSGPGGQNVNKVNTRVTLWFDVANSPSLSVEQKERILSCLETRVNKKGVLRVVSQRYRTQTANRETAVERFLELLREALEEEKPRQKTKVSQPSRERRLHDKRRRALIKQQRSQRISWES
ncbi:MAG: aminoacyl-tRNA hydrolase [Desulfobacterales bacterium]|nr:aminoacyl-tRNA hydrolase [Desulfobacterales bacterium]